MKLTRYGRRHVRKVFSPWYGYWLPVDVFVCQESQESSTASGVPHTLPVVRLGQWWRHSDHLSRQSLQVRHDLSAEVVRVSFQNWACVYLFSSSSLFLLLFLLLFLHSCLFTPNVTPFTPFWKQENLVFGVSHFRFYRKEKTKNLVVSFLARLLAYSRTSEASTSMTCTNDFPLDKTFYCQSHTIEVPVPRFKTDKMRSNAKNSVFFLNYNLSWP